MVLTVAAPLDDGSRSWEPIGVPIYYAMCGSCGFLWAPEMHAWTPEMFKRRIYNTGYAARDPGFGSRRPNVNAESLTYTFGEFGKALRHLDYGSGSGELGRVLCQAGWQTEDYDPFYHQERPSGPYDLLTAFEVVEHVPDQHGMVDSWTAMGDANATFLFSTQLSDGHVYRGCRLSWWYATPGSGHISLHTYRSLDYLAERHGLKYRSLSDGLHVMWRGRCLLK